MALRYVEQRPRAELRPHIECLWLVSDPRSCSERAPERVVPDGCPELIVYFASPRSRPPVPFKLVESGERRAVFENRAHDFPQRILYWLDSQGAMHARIEGPQAGKTVSQEWAWRKSR